LALSRKIGFSSYWFLFVIITSCLIGIIKESCAGTAGGKQNSDGKPLGRSTKEIPGVPSRSGKSVKVLSKWIACKAQSSHILLKSLG